MMNSTIVAVVLGAAVLAASLSPSVAAPVPCEDMLTELRANESAAELSDVEKVQVAGLEAKGVERCNADDDKRADAFFAQALKVITKK